jgi:hypothetical protein
MWVDNKRFIESERLLLLPIIVFTAGGPENQPTPVNWAPWGRWLVFDIVPNGSLLPTYSSALLLTRDLFQK